MRARWLAGVAAVVLLLPSVLWAQDRTITGRVTRSDTGQPVIGAAIVVVAPSGYSPSYSGADGRFTIRAPTAPSRLRITAFGFTPMELAVAAEQSVIEASLASDVFRLSDVVVTGQATTIDRRSATTAIAYVSGEEVNRVSSPTLLNAMTGKITGVNLQTNSGAPGGGIQMQIRGNATILGAFDPLYVVDGVIYSNASVPSGRGFVNNAAVPVMEADPVNRIADLNPADIASIEVLKGAAASSIYGSKAANGVVVINTVRGHAGAPQINVSQRLGYSTPMRSLSERHWTEAEAVARFGEVARPFFQGNASPYFDQYAQVYSNRRPSYETLADVRGGTEATRYYLAGSWKHDEGIERETFATRQSLRANLDQMLSSSVDLRVSSVFSRSENDRGWNNNCNNFGCHGYAIAYIPSFVDLTRRDPDGTFPTPTVGPQSNPVQLTELGINHEETLRFTGGATLDWNLLQAERQNLRLSFGGGLDGFDQKNDVWSPNDLFFERTQAQPGESLESGGRSLFYNWNANAVHSFNGSSFGATTSFGIQYEDRRLHTQRIRTQNLLPGQRNVNRGTNIAAEEHLEQERTLAIYAQEAIRLLDERLLLLGGVRAERSSVNGDPEKYFVFPKASASYRFLDLIGADSEVKIRVAYGETGNQPIFGQKFTNLSTPQLGGQQGVSVSTVSGSPNVEPERLREIEGGIDGFALDGRFTWELTGFSRNTTNLLLQRVPAPSTGYATEIFNGGKIRNSGLEIGIGYSPIQTAHLQWVARGTFTRYSSEVVDMAGLPAFFPAASGFGNLGRTRIEEGKPITQIVAFDYDASGNRTSTLVQVGNTAPDFRVGFVNDVRVGALSLSGVVDWQQGGNVINLTQYLYDHSGNAHDFGQPSYEERNGARLAGVMSPYIEDATFVKIRELALMLDVPQRFHSPLNLGARTLRLGLTGRNLHTWTNYNGLDPEVGNFGAAAIRSNLDIGPYPPSRSFYFNVTVGF